ncbi:arylsulfatase A-like enzyme [Jejuia pallidilutea]|uniref:Arylsulfatase A-like enzyme n=1 Tax=Jejuia pallidilutea TaxID=504487 RepID=A0A362X4Z4_9FLAO|nr:arylsulfatase [Jejuia pallidilutea]PQV51519.1 arylsulfatase A-like enzyme [Jejuia pallidilutea]
MRLIKSYKTLFLLLGSFVLLTCKKDKPTVKPNIVIFYVDDLGYGDVSCYGAIGVKTPNIDKLAKNGVRFTDAHSSAATCTPSRYTLLTGRYAFRQQAEILPGDAPLLIRPETPTIASMLKSEGYKTAVIGKWHLGLGNGDINWNKALKPGPHEIGFDYSFLLPATGDRVPAVYTENGKVVNLSKNDSLEVSYKTTDTIGARPTGWKHPELLRYAADEQHSGTIINGVSRIGTMKGGYSAEWKDEDFPDILTGKAKNFIQSSKEQPFFLYFSFHDIHVPRLPHPRFEGASSMGPRGDAIAQMDWVTGEIVKELEKLKLADKTLIIFTSDNGPVLNDGYEDFAIEKLGDHKPSGIYRGGKYSAFEGGTRVPTITYWPGKIKTSENNALWSQVDIYASLAKLVGHTPNSNEAEDSNDILNVILGKSNQTSHPMLEESFVLSIRDGKWKYIQPMDKDRVLNDYTNKGIEGGASHDPQLYNLETDPEERINVASSNREQVEKMDQMIQEIIDKE